MKDYGPASALAVSIIVAVLYAQGGAAQVVASLIILTVLLAPVNGKSLLVGLVEYLDAQLKGQATK